MKSERREFLQMVGAGAIGMELAATAPSASAQNAAKSRSKLKIIFRADDVGYTDVHNIGTFEAIEKGVVTAADIMLECPGTVDALKKLKTMPWISVGWHTHFWGSPVLDPKQVPSLVMNDEGRIRFKKDLSSAKDVVFEEALKEMRAQLDRCVKLLGRAPDTGPGGGRGDSPYGKAMSQVVKEYKIRNYVMPINPGAWAGGAPPAPGQPLSGRLAVAALNTDSLTDIMKYDPLMYYLNDTSHILDLPEGSIDVEVWHPGYVDYFVLHMGSSTAKANNYLLCRPKDVEALTSPKLKSWIKEHRLELINFRDAMDGTNEYQNHLKAIGSDLCMI